MKNISSKFLMCMLAKPCAIQGTTKNLQGLGLAYAAGAVVDLIPAMTTNIIVLQYHSLMFCAPLCPFFS